MNDASIEQAGLAAKTRIRVLILEDNPSDADLMVDALRLAGLDPQWERVDTEPDFAARLTQDLDLILSDYSLPQFNGVQALQLVRLRGLDVPFILVSGSIGEDIAVEAMREGADDYLLKDRMARLGPAVLQAIEKKQLRDESRRAAGALARVNRVLAVLSGINALIVRVRDRDELFREACRIAVEHGKFGMAWIGLFDPDTLEVTPAAWAGPGADQFLGGVKSSIRVDLPTGQGMLAQAIRTREPAFDNDILKSPGAGGARRTEAIRLGYRSFISLPLVIEQNVVGNLSLFAKEPNFFNEEELKLLTELAGDISYALEHIAGQQKIEKLSRIRAVSSEINAAIIRIRDRQSLFDEACRIAAEHGKFEMAWIGTLDREAQEFRPTAWVGLDAELLEPLRISMRDDGPASRGTISRALRSKQPVWENDFEADPDSGYTRRQMIQRGYYSAISLPLVVDGEADGVFVLYARERGFFTEDEISMLTELAGNVSFALKHIAGQQKIERLSRVRAVSSEINSAIVRARSKQELYFEACRIAVEHGGFGIVWMGEYDPETQEITPVASAGLEDSSFLMKDVTSARADSPKGQGAVQRAARERRPVCINDIAIDSKVGGYRHKEAIRRGYRSVIGLPLIVDGAVAGTFSMFAKEVGFFNGEEIDLLTELAGNISFALEHISRQQKIDTLSRIRAVSSEINGAIVRLRDRDALLRETCHIAAEHGKFGLVWVASLDAEKQEVRPVAWTGFSKEAAHAVNWATIIAAKGTLGEAMLTRKAAVRNDIETQMPVGKLRHEALKAGCQSTICLPLVLGNSVVALIALFAAGRGFFDKDELALLGEVAANISFALEAIAAQARVERLSRIRTVLGEMNAAIVRIRDKQALFDEACRIAVEAGRFQFAWLGLVDRQANQVKPVAWTGTERGFLSTMQEHRMLDDQTTQGPKISARAVLEKKPVIVNDVQNDPRVYLKQEHRQRNINSIAMLPLLIADEAVGVLSLHAEEAGFFDEDEIKLLAELAGDISFAMQTIEKQEKLDYLSYYDALTGLPNRTLYLERLGQCLDAAGAGEQVVVMLGDIRRLRMINETLGRQAGDEILRQVAKRLAGVVRNPESLARISADWFATFMPNIRDIGEAAHRIEQMRVGFLRNPYPVADRELTLAFTLGAAVYPADGKDADSLLANAEAALKKAKATGESLLFYEPSINARVAESLELENKLRRALEKEQFVLHYQPKIELANGRICGLEALIRWNDPETGLVPPMKFIPLLEETGMILDAGRWAMQQALRDYREWTEHGLQPPRIAVNVSPIQLRQKDFVDVVRDAIGSPAAGSHGLDLEITESVVMEDIAGNIQKLRAIRDMGVNIAIDDFGTGYSSLGYLAKLPVNALKIDRSFIIVMAKDPDSMSIVSAIISLAHSLNLTVVAEGVDADDQRKILHLLKCDEMQGYLFSKPLPADALVALLRGSLPGSEMSGIATSAPSQRDVSPNRATTVKGRRT